MDGKQQIIDMIVSKNQEVIDSYDVVLDADSLILSLPVAGSFEGSNTKVLATASHPKVIGNQTFLYNRITQPILLELLGNPDILIPKTCKSILDVATYFSDVHNLQIDLDQIRTADHQPDRWVITFKPTSYIWAGTFTFAAEVDEVNPIIIPLKDIITKTLLDGLYYPDVVLTYPKRGK